MVLVVAVDVVVEHNTFPHHSAVAKDNTLVLVVVVVAEVDNVLVAVDDNVVVGPGRHSRRLAAAAGRVRQK